MTLAAQVLAVLAEAPSSYRDLAERLDVSPRRVSEALSGLRRRGLVAATVDARWRRLSEPVARVAPAKSNVIPFPRFGHMIEEPGERFDGCRNYAVCLSTLVIAAEHRWPRGGAYVGRCPSECTHRRESDREAELLHIATGRREE